MRIENIIWISLTLFLLYVLFEKPCRFCQWVNGVALTSCQYLERKELKNLSWSLEIKRYGGNAPINLEKKIDWERAREKFERLKQFKREEIELGDFDDGID